MSASGMFRTIDAGARAVLLVLVGLVFLAVGFGGAIYLIEQGVKHPPFQKGLIYASGAVGVFGALMLPGILGPAVNVSKQVIVIIQQLPVVGPMFGGRRAGDPPLPPPAP